MTTAGQAFTAWGAYDQDDQPSRIPAPLEELLRYDGHGDGLVLRGLSELPVVPGPARPRSPAETHRA